MAHSKHTAPREPRPKKKTGRLMIASFLALLMMAAVLIGTTFAWFTDMVKSEGNIIKSGNLDLSLSWTDDPTTGVWYDAEGEATNTMFDDSILWEPGHVQVRYLKIQNKGNLAFQYKFGLLPKNNMGKLAEVIDVWCLSGAELPTAATPLTRESLKNKVPVGTLNNLATGKEDNAYTMTKGYLLPAGQTNTMVPNREHIVAIALAMQETAGNEYQGTSIGDGFVLCGTATQMQYESDSFGTDYDQNLQLPAYDNNGTTVQLSIPNGAVDTLTNTVTEQIVLQSSGITATLPEDTVLAENATGLELTITELDKKDSNIQLDTTTTQDVKSYDIHVTGLGKDNKAPVIVEMGTVFPANVNLGNLQVLHAEDGKTIPMTQVNSKAELTAHNTFYYDNNTGALTLAMASFSEVGLLVDAQNKWHGNIAPDWYDANVTDLTIDQTDELAAFATAVASGENFTGKTVTLTTDIDLKNVAEGANETVFYPIGNWYQGTNGRYAKDTGVAFTGTFDGGNHTISGLTQDGYNMKHESGTEYNRAFGLFYKLDGATVQNLTLADGNLSMYFGDMGMVAAYSSGNTTLSSITVENSEVRGYNSAVGGVIGEHISGTLTMQAVQVPDTTTVAALWGTYDVAAGGLLGYLDKGAKADFTDCETAAKLDVYNDVCANYQYYQYRYSGAMIGTIEQSALDSDGTKIPDLSCITAQNCKVTIGEWNQYYYCEFAKNGKGSYATDFKFSRVPEDELIKDPQGRVTGCTHEHSEEEDKQAVALPFTQLFTTYGQGVRGYDKAKLEAYNTANPEKALGITVDCFELRVEPVEKFAVKLPNTDKYLYRVGNQNAVALGSLFTAVEAPAIPVVDSAVTVAVESLDSTISVNHTFTANTTDWTKSKLQFNGTGPVKVTITDQNDCVEKELLLEVVEAYNVTTYSELGNRNSVLLADVAMPDEGKLEFSKTLYGNGYTLDVTKGTTTATSRDDTNGVIRFSNANVDNVKIIGKVLSAFADTTSDSNNIPTVLSSGNTTIINSYISNGASPIRIYSGTLNLQNSTVKGGTFCNIDVRGATLNLTDVTTINQVSLNDTATSGTTPVGLGIVVHHEKSDNAKIHVNGTLNQYNYLSENQKSNVALNGTANTLFAQMFNLSNIVTNVNGTKWVNTGILSMNSQVNAADITGVPATYTGLSVSQAGITGYVTSKKPTESDITSSVSAWQATKQAPTKPNMTVQAFDNGSIIEGESYTLENIRSHLTATKNEQSLTGFTVEVVENNNLYNATTDTITLTEKGTYTIRYTVTDPYTYGADGKQGTATTWTITTQVSLEVLKPEIKAPEFTFHSVPKGTGSWSETKTDYTAKLVEIGNDIWIMPDVDAEVNDEIGSVEKSGITVYYPIVKGTSSTSGLLT